MYYYAYHLLSYLEGLSSRTDPRLLNTAAYSFPDKYNIRPFAPFKRRFKPYVKADEILKQSDLSGSVAIVTGASSGLGQSAVQTGFESDIVLYWYRI